MGGGGQHPGAVCLRRRDDEAPGLAQRLAHLGHRVAHPRVGLDLGAEELAHNLVRPAGALAGRENALVRIGEEIAALRIDEKEFFLDPERDGEAVSGLGGPAHGAPPAPCGRRSNRRGYSLLVIAETSPSHVASVRSNIAPAHPS